GEVRLVQRRAVVSNAKVCASSSAGIKTFHRFFVPSSASMVYSGITEPVFGTGELTIMPFNVAGSEVCCWPSKPHKTVQPPMGMVPRSIVPGVVEALDRGATKEG